MKNPLAQNVQGDFLRIFVIGVDMLTVRKFLKLALLDKKRKLGISFDF